MKESKFIKTNQEKWQSQEKGILNNSMSAEELERSFIELNDDLAYAQTFYKNRSIKVFLNNLLTPVYTNIYKGRKWSFKTLSNFFSHEAPEVFYHARHYIFISFIAVMLGVGLGYFGAQRDKEFITTILGSGYVAQTEANIEKGDPLGIYKHASPAEMFYGIATNNLMVGFYFFVFGVFFCVGTLYFLFSNGIMLGVFTYMFTSRGLGTEYLLTVYQHGTLEILSMVMEGAAGIMLGAGIFFPGTYSRMRSIQDKARKAIIILIVCLPIILLAAFIESYLTRFTEINTWLRAGIILLSLFFMLYYFIIYPWLRFRGGRAVKGHETVNESELSSMPAKNRIYSVGNTLLFAINYLKQHFSKLSLFAIFCALILFAITEYISGDAIAEDVKFQMRNWGAVMRGATGESDNFALNVAGLMGMLFKFIFFNIYASKYLFHLGEIPALALPCFLVIFVTLLLAFQNMKRFMDSGEAEPVSRMRMISGCLFCALICTSLNFMMGELWWMNMLFVFPFLIILLTFVFCFYSGSNVFMALPAVFKVYLGSFWRIIGSITVIFLLYFVLMFGFWLVCTVAIMQSESFHGGSLMSKGLLMFYVRGSWFVMPIMLSIYIYQFSLLSFSIHEKNFGRSLFRSIQDIAFKKEVYGVETE